MPAAESNNVKKRNKLFSLKELLKMKKRKLCYLVRSQVDQMRLGYYHNCESEKKAFNVFSFTYFFFKQHQGNPVRYPFCNM